MKQHTAKKVLAGLLGAVLLSTPQPMPKPVQLFTARILRTAVHRYRLPEEVVSNPFPSPIARHTAALLP